LSVSAPFNDLDPGLEARLDTPLPRRLELGRGNALFLHGSCFHRDGAIGELRLLAGEESVPLGATGMPRLDRPAYRSGFWTILPFPRRRSSATVAVLLEARLTDGRRSRALLGEVELVAGAERQAASPPAASPAVGGPETVAICMATHNPDPRLFAAQIASIREQTDQRWVCLVSDDCSGPASFARIEAELEGDARFAVSRSDAHLGFYRNFERALSLAPAGAPLIALCDQDDRWHPDKLAVLRASIGSAQLVYSDQRIVDPRGEVIAGTYWTARRNNHTSLASLLMANTVTGAASMLKRELLDYALPFPPAPGYPYHDHWLGLVALSLDGLAYVDRPLYDYVQHADAALGHSRANTPAGGRHAWLHRLRRGQRPAVGWRSTYFLEYCRLALLATVLQLRCSERLTGPSRRTLKRLVRAEHSPPAAAWLLGRSLRGLAGHTETLGAERRLATGIAWRHALALLALGRDAPSPRMRFDASLPEGYEPGEVYRPDER
jgi:glycosyltransferase involved in cell wall biosynthesis